MKTYSRLRHLGLLRFCGFQAVSHVTAAAHTLIACMLRSSNLAFEHRPDLLTAIDVLLVFSSPFPYVKTVAQLLVQLSRTLDYRHGSTSQSEAVAIRVLARKMARSPTNVEPPLSPSTFSWLSWNGDSSQRADTEALFRQVIGAGPSNGRSNHNQSSIPDTALVQAHPGETSNFVTTNDASGLQPTPPVEPQWMHNVLDDAMEKVNSAWEDSFSFLNDGLFNNL